MRARGSDARASTLFYYTLYAIAVFTLNLSSQLTGLHASRTANWGIHSTVEIVPGQRLQKTE